MSSVMLACAEEEQMMGLGSLGLTAAQKAAADEKKAANAAAALARKKAAADAAEAKRQAKVAASNLPPAEKRKAIASANAAINKARASEVKSITETKKAALANAKTDLKVANVAAKEERIAKHLQGKTLSVSKQAAPVADALNAEIEKAKKKNQDLKNKFAQIKANPPRKQKALRGLGWFGGRLGSHARRRPMARRQRRGMGSCCSGFLSEMGLGDIDPLTGQETGTGGANDNSYLIQQLQTELATAKTDEATKCAKRPTAPKCLYARMTTADKQQMLFMISILDQINASNEALMQQILQLLQSQGTAPCYDAAGNPIPCAPSGGYPIDPTTGLPIDPYTGQTVYATPQGYVQPGYDPYGPQMVADPSGGGAGYDPYGGAFIDTTGPGITPISVDQGGGMEVGGADVGYAGPAYDPYTGGEGDSYESDAGLEYASDEATPAPSYATRSRPIIRDPYIEESQVSTRDSGPTFDTIVDQEVADEGGGYDDGGDWN